VIKKENTMCVIEVKVRKVKNISNTEEITEDKKGGQCEDCDKWASL
jgi:hypothetical protein